MAEVERLLREFASAFEENGEVNPQDYVSQLEGIDRAELEALIDAYIEHAPARAWDAAAFEGSDASQLAERLHTSVIGKAGLWPTLLPRLRDRARLKRSEVVKRLATELGHAEATDKVGGYYHEMESGLLASEGVSDKVLEALARILDWTTDGLRQAGHQLGTGDTADPGQVFARAIRTQADDLIVEELDADSGWDEVDELFRGPE